jgi:hypothetical protein
MLKSMIVLAVAAALTGGLTADALCRGGGGRGGGGGHGTGFGGRNSSVPVRLSSLDAPA